MNGEVWCVIVETGRITLLYANRWGGGVAEAVRETKGNEVETRINGNCTFRVVAVQV
jgi:hypothetical protein